MGCHGYFTEKLNGKHRSIDKINGNKMTVKMDGGQIREFNTKNNKHFDMYIQDRGFELNR